MIKDIIKEIVEGCHAILLILPNEKYKEDIFEVAKQLSNIYNHVCYVNLNKLHDILIKDLDAKKINTKKFYFIDAITKTINQSVKDSENVKYVSSPMALTELSLCMTGEHKKYNSDCLLFDSLSTLLVYHQANTVTRFAQSVIAKMAADNTIIVFSVLEGDAESALVKDLGMFVDKIVHLDR